MDLDPKDAPAWAVLAAALAAAIYKLFRIVKGDNAGDRRDAVAEKVTKNLMTLWQESTARADALAADFVKVSAKLTAVEAELAELRAEFNRVERELQECNAERARLLREYGALDAAKKAEQALEDRLRSTDLY